MSQEHAPNVENMRGTELPGYCRMHEPTQHHRGISVTTSHVVLIALLTGAESIETTGNFLFLATNGAPREIWNGAEWWRRTMTVECKCRICKGKEHWDPPRPPNPLHVGSWRYQDVPLTQKQADEAQWVNDVGWMVPDTSLRAIAAAWWEYLEIVSILPPTEDIHLSWDKFESVMADNLTEEDNDESARFLQEDAEQDADIIEDDRDALTEEER